jgi:MFS family permease
VTQELGLTRAATSLVFSLARAQGAIEGPLAGYCIDRYGPRPVITIAVLLAGIGYMMLADVYNYTALLIVYMGVISLSYQAGFMDATMAVANTWFIRKRACHVVHQRLHCLGRHAHHAYPCIRSAYSGLALRCLRSGRRLSPRRSAARFLDPPLA